MNALRILTLGFLLATTLGQAQEILRPGWFNSSGWLEPSTYTNAYAARGPLDLGLLSGGGSESIAEASTPEIEALARGLGNDPQRIFHFVHDRIRHVLYFGSKKGAQLTLLEGSGNDFDQCALLVALLRAAGFSPSYQFGVLRMPYESSDHVDVRHWLGLSLINTNAGVTQDYFSYILGSRGYPYLSFSGGTNSVAFHRVWVKVAIDGTDYYLDPAFKITEPVAGIDLPAAMGFGSNALMTAAGGTVTADSVQSVSEVSLRNKLRDYTTNVLAYIQSNVPNATVVEVLGGRQPVFSAGLPLSQSVAFPIYTSGGQLPVLDWANQPTNLMSKLSVSFSGTNFQWLIPGLQGARLSFSFTSNGLVQLWQEDTLLIQKTTSGGTTIPVTLGVDHAHGTWSLANNTLVDSSFNDQSFTTGHGYQRTNATYALVYGFDVGPGWLRDRQQRLDEYRQKGFSDTSREVVTESLNIMGLNWLVQTELVDRNLAQQLEMIPQRHHRLGRMGQEKGRGYFIDVQQLNGIVPANGHWVEDVDRLYRTVDLMAYFGSALEHGVIEQLQAGSMTAASTVKMLQLGNTNGLKTFLVNVTNWSVVSPQLVNHDLVDLYWYMTNGYSLLLSANGAFNIAGPGSWGGHGIVALGFYDGYRSTDMMIAGGFFGGFGADSTATVDPEAISSLDGFQPNFFDLNSFIWDMPGADPVSMTDGSFNISKTDLDVGQTEPRGIAFSRFYSSARRFRNASGMAHGWVHNYDCDVAEVSAPLPGLGETTPEHMAPLLVATRAAAEIYNLQPTPKNWLVTTLIAKWGVDQLIKNGVSVSLGKDTLQFIKQPDGRLSPPANVTMTLLKTNSAYTLSERHGNSFKFNTAGRLTNIVDQYNQPLSVTYNSSNWVATVKDWKNRTFTFSYSGTPQRLTSVTDGSRTVTYGYATSYSAQGDLVSVTDPESKTSTFRCDTNHQIIATLNALNQTVVSNRYDGFGRVIEQYSSGDTNQTWRLYWSGYENGEEDPAGGQRLFYYDDKHRLSATRDALGNVSRTFYDGQDHAVMTVSPLNETNRFVFDGQHNLTLAIDPLGYSNQFVFDGLFNLIRQVDARGNSNRFGYNAKFQLTGSTNGAGDWTTFAYNATDGTLTSRTDPGGTTTYGYDANGLLSGITHPGSLGSEGFVNHARGDILSRTNARGFVTSFQYNLRRELTNTIAPTNLTASVAYDAVGNVQSQTDARGFTSSSTWSATRKLLSTTLPATPQGTPVVTNVYDFRDWLSRTVNPLQQATRFTNDSAGRLVSVTDPLLRTTRFGFDADGRKVAATNAAQEASSQAWTARGELTRTTDGGNRTALRQYDAAGNQVTLTNRNGKKWQFQFDAANRLTNTITPLNRKTSQSWNDRGLLASVKEPSGEAATLTYDAKGRLTNRMDAVASTVFRYDLNNNVTNILEAGKTNVWTFDAYDRATSYRDADGNLIQYRYDANGNMTNLIYPGGRAVAYAFDSLNRLTNVTDWAGRKTSLTYDLASRMTSITRPNGTQRTIGYDAAGQTTNILEKTATGVPIALFKFQWNNAARMDWEFAAPLPHAYTPPSRTMTFDDDNRLATLNSQTVVHDLDGNMTTGPLTNNALASYSYDARNRLLNAGGISYGHDVSGNRTSITNGANVTKLVVNPNAALSQVLMRVRSGVTNYYIYGAGLQYEITETANSTNMLAYHYDYRGSTVALTDSNGTVTDRVEYSPYAMTTFRSGTNDTPFLFNGRYGVQTDANGLLFMRARYYNPYLCRFVNADPSGFGGGLNHYAYADGNPVSMIDPFGLAAAGESSWSWLAGAGMGVLSVLQSIASVDGGSNPAQWAQMGAALTIRYGASGYYAENGGWNTAFMMVGGFTGVVPFAEGVYGVDMAWGTSLSSFESGSRTATGTIQMAGTAMSMYGGAMGAMGSSASGTTAISPYRFTTSGETFYHYGYAENAGSFVGGIRPGGFATSTGNLSAAAAESGLALPPRSSPPNAVYTVSPTPGTPIRANPVASPNFGQPGGLPEYQFPVGTMPGTVSGPTVVR